MKYINFKSASPRQIYEWIKTGKMPLKEFLQYVEEIKELSRINN